MARSELLVYLAGPIAGLTWEEAHEWRVEFACDLPARLRCLDPTRAKNFLSGQVIGIKPYDIHPLATDKGLTRRDLFDVGRSDAILFNFLGTDNVSVGSCIEIGASAMVAQQLRVLVIEPNNIHDHPMIREIVDYTVPTLEEAARLLTVLL